MRETKQQHLLRLMLCLYGGLFCCIWFLTDRISAFPMKCKDSTCLNQGSSVKRGFFSCWVFFYGFFPLSFWKTLDLLIPTSLLLAGKISVMANRIGKQNLHSALAQLTTLSDQCLSSLLVPQETGTLFLSSGFENSLNFSLPVQRRVTLLC